MNELVRMHCPTRQLFVLVLLGCFDDCVWCQAYICVRRGCMYSVCISLYRTSLIHVGVCVDILRLSTSFL